jgi:hypothetical protein
MFAVCAACNRDRDLAVVLQRADFGPSALNRNVGFDFKLAVGGQRDSIGTR